MYPRGVPPERLATITDGVAGCDKLAELDPVGLGCITHEGAGSQ